MGENSSISWCDNTWNPWVGCTKVSPACDHCYAETYGKRFGIGWGPHAARRRTAESTWKHPLAWNRKAEREGSRLRVFCASLADVFDNQVDASWRADLFALIQATPHLDWLLLTKRPQNIAKMLPDDWGAGYPNVWLGTTVENQVEADRRIPHLLGVPAAKRFLSCEPLLGPVDLLPWLPPVHHHPDNEPCPELDALVAVARAELRRRHPEAGALDWVITGGESGKDARPSHPDWFRSLRDQCAAAGVAFHMKQWGEWTPAGEWYAEHPVSLPLRGLGPDGWTDDAEVCAADDYVVRLGTKRSGHLLDGVEHRAVPA
jgi:protein gp37